MAPEHIVEIANYLQPSDKLSLSLATPSANFLRPQFDQVVVNNFNIGNKVNFMRRIFDLNVTRNVNEMKVLFLRRGKLCRICDGHHGVNFKKNLFCTGEETTERKQPMKFFPHRDWELTTFPPRVEPLQWKETGLQLTPLRTTVVRLSKQKYSSSIQRDASPLPSQSGSTLSTSSLLITKELKDVILETAYLP